MLNCYRLTTICKIMITFVGKNGDMPSFIVVQ